MDILKKWWADIACIILFTVISLVYFYPADLDGRRLNQHDNGADVGLGVEINEYRQTHDGETPRWTNSVFGGMPTYQIAPSYDSVKKMSFIEKAYHLWLPDYVFYIFISMLGFYILLRAFDFRQWMAALGAIVWAFSSYFFIIIAAGHIWKVLTLAYIPPTIAGMILCYRRRYLPGCGVTALFASLQIMSNHVQMTYYFLIPELLIVIALLIESLVTKDKRSGFRSWIKGTASIAVAAVIAIGLNASSLYHTYEYSKDTMRAKSELVKADKVGDQTDSGLERSYITAWSYGIGETWTLLIPNVRGGASVPLSQNGTAMKKADPLLANNGIYGAFTQYWGEQPGTSGPVYVGALVCMLFILSLLVLPNQSPLKWALVAATVLSILLSWGHNFMPFTNFFIDHVPMYAKFRTVSSILVVAEFTIPLLAMLGLKRFVDLCADKRKRPWMLGALAISAAVTVFICILFAVIPQFGECLSSNDRTAVAQYIAKGYFDETTGQNILSSISKMRAAMLTSDAWRSAVIILLGGFFLFRMAMGKAKTLFVPNYVFIIAICLFDMWAVNKRYLNDSMFEAPRTAASIQKGDADNYIQSVSGTGRDYRVLNYTVSTFNDNTTSYFYSSVGGYHPAKLRRYQELIEAHISPEMQKVFDALRTAPLDTAAMARGVGYPVYDLAKADADSLFPVINMLNTRWFILPGQNNIHIPVENNAAYGNAWFVEDVLWVGNANEELSGLRSVSPRHTAVIDRQFSGLFAGKNLSGSKGDTTATIRQTALTADEVTYEADSKKGGLVVFSEIYYPGWTATIDGEPADIGRADYVLRAMYVPAGKHTIHMEFHPESVSRTELVANISFAALILIIAAAIVMGVRDRRKARKR